jgi:hypothetical protein
LKGDATTPTMTLVEARPLIDAGQEWLDRLRQSLIFSGHGPPNQVR